MFLCILVTFVPSFIFSNEHFFLLLLNTTTVEIVEELSRIILLDFCGEVLLWGDLEELSTEPLATEWPWSSSTIGVPRYWDILQFTVLVCILVYHSPKYLFLLRAYITRSMCEVRIVYRDLSNLLDVSSCDPPLALSSFFFPRSCPPAGNINYL